MWGSFRALDLAAGLGADSGGFANCGEFSPVTLVGPTQPFRARPPALATALFILALGAAVGMIGPFGAYVSVSLPVRIGYFALAAALIGGPISLGLSWALRRSRSGFEAVLATVLIAAVAAIPGTFVVEFLLGRLAPQVLPHVGRWELAGQTLLLNEVLSLLALTVLRRPWPDLRRRAANAGNPLAPHLPARLARSQILAIACEDHYLRVHTDGGEALIHMRMSEAERLLAKREGLRVHRSYWVAARAVAGVERSGGRVMLKLTGGLAAPVSRSRMSAVRAAGWLEKV
jgi:hypothetical protein